MAKTIRLNNGILCPIIGLGLGGYATGGPPQDQQVIELVSNAIDIGYRHFDTANNYCNEISIGEAINQCISSGKVRRDELFLTTKIFSDIRFEKDLRRGRSEALEYIRKATQKLNTPYVDLMLLHYPSRSGDTELDYNTWLGFEDALKEGLVKSIGVSNFNVQQLESLVHRVTVVPAMNQVECHPLLNQRQLIDYCAKYDICLTASSPLNKGQLNDNPIISSIGNKYTKSSAQVLIRWQIQRGIVAIPKSTKTERLRENIDVFDFRLTEDEMKTLENIK